MPIPRNKAVVGENAFAHEAGIHQHGVLHHHSTYEILRPEDVGLPRSNLVLGKHSGRHAFRDRVKALGFELEEAELNRVFEEFKALADQQEGTVRRRHRGAGAARRKAARPDPGASTSLDTMAAQQCAGARRWCSCRHTDGRTVERKASGDGPVDAAFKAIEAATGIA